MLNRNQVYTLLKLRNREGNLFSHMPTEIITLISDSPTPDSDVAILLEHVAFGEQVEAEEMIKANPRLLLHAGNVTMPSGLQLVRITPYECALGGGDDRMATMMATYFSQIPDGKKERDEQYERYQPHIDNMLKQKSYDLKWLIDIIRKCSDEDIAFALNLDTKHMSKELLNALTRFRNDHTPGTMVKSGMHFNYQSLDHAFDIYGREFKSLTNGNNFDRCRLVWQQVVCFELRNLSAIDRQVLAFGLSYVVDGVNATRTFEFKNNKGSFFPHCRSQGYSSHVGFGFDYDINIYGCGGRRIGTGGWGGDAARCSGVIHSLWNTYIERKNSSLKNLCSNDLSSRCNLLGEVDATSLHR